jgi:hypothetical protein
MHAEHAISVLIPLLVLAVLWTVVRHWILPFVLGFALAVALGPSARPLMASVWAAVAGVGEAVFGSRGEMRRDIAEPRPWSPERRGPMPGRYEDE